MKKCPACGYEDKNGNLYCPVCSASLKNVKNEIENKNKIFPKIIFLSLLICYFLSFKYFYLTRKNKKIPAKHIPDYALSYEEKTEKSIKSLAKVIIPDKEEERIVFSFSEKGSDRIRLTSCETLLYWAAYSKTSRDTYLKKAADPLYDPLFKEKNYLFGMFSYFLKVNIFFPQELAFMKPVIKKEICLKSDYLNEINLDLAFKILDLSEKKYCCEKIKKNSKISIAIIKKCAL